MDNRLNEVKCFLLDLDGTVYLGGRLLPGAKEAVERLRERAKVVFLTNNSSVSRKDYVMKINAMGIKCTENDVYTSGLAAAAVINRDFAGKKVYLVGTDRLKTEFTEQNINLVEIDYPELVVIAFDTSLTYEKLSRSCKYIREGVPFMATHPDFNCPTGDGAIPDTGSFLALIKASTGCDPFLICGKPHAPMVEGIESATGIKVKDMAMVGDRLMTDIKFANSNGFLSILVLSGETKLPDLETSTDQPDLILNSIADFFV